MNRNDGVKEVKRVVAALKDIRLEQGISHEKLAILSGLNRSSISRIESGINSPTLLSLFLICNALKIDLADVLKSLNS